MENAFFFVCSTLCNYLLSREIIIEKNIMVESCAKALL